MPYQRYVTCEQCVCEIDREYDDYDVLDCGCCYRCMSCPEQDGRSSRHTSHGRGTIHPYSYKPRRYLSKGDYPTEVLMGIELEVGGNQYHIADRVYDVNESQDHLYCKSDCSVYGTEIVSHPMTLNYAKSWGGWHTLLETLREDDCFNDQLECSDRGCGSSYCDHEYGLHIHVSRNAFRQLRKRRTMPEVPADDETYEQRIGREFRELARQQRDQQAINHQMIWLMFLERNADQLNGDTKLARRDSSHYGAFKKSTLHELRAKSEEGRYLDEQRYTAINCQNTATYELRFFKSTVNTEEFFASLEFADASVEFTRTLNANDVLRGQALQWPKFVDWVNAQQVDSQDSDSLLPTMRVAKYPNLIAQINTLALV